MTLSDIILTWYFAETISLALSFMSPTFNIRISGGRLLLRRSIISLSFIPSSKSMSTNSLSLVTPIDKGSENVIFWWGLNPFEYFTGSSALIIERVKHLSKSKCEIYLAMFNFENLRRLLLKTDTSSKAGCSAAAALFAAGWSCLLLIRPLMLLYQEWFRNSDISVIPWQNFIISYTA